MPVISGGDRFEGLVFRFFGVLLSWCARFGVGIGVLSASSCPGSPPRIGDGCHQAWARQRVQHIRDGAEWAWALGAATGHAPLCRAVLRPPVLLRPLVVVGPFVVGWFAHL